VAAQTVLVLVRTRVARLHSHGTDLVVVPSWLCALRALQGHRRHDGLARLRRRRAVPHRSCYRSMIGRSIPASEVTWSGRRHIKGRLPPRCQSGLPAAPSRNEKRDSSNNRDTGNTGETKKIVEISVLATTDDRLFLRDVLRLFCRTFSLDRVPPPRACWTPTFPRLLSLHPLSLLRHLPSIPRSVTGLVYPSPLAWVLADWHGDGSRGTRDSARRSPSIGWTIDQLVATTCDSEVICAWLFPYWDSGSMN